MHGSDLEMRLAAAAAVAREAGTLALRHYRQRDRLEIEGKGLQDIVSIADREVEDLVRLRLGRLFPDDGVLGEEGGMVAGTAGTWVIDPIDGTWCFLNGIASWCVALAYVRENVTVIGVIYDPNSGEMFTAAKGKGAWLDGVPMRVHTGTRLTDGSLSVGFSHRSKPEEIAPIFGPLLAAGGMYQRHGSGALGLAWTACGRLIGYVEPHMNSWDAIAGLLMVSEAGGWTNDFMADNGLVDGNRVIAVPPALKDQVTALLPW